MVINSHTPSQPQVPAARKTQINPTGSMGLVYLPTFKPSFAPKNQPFMYRHLPRGANKTQRDVELTPFSNHLAPFGRSR